ncbi:SIR2 family protein [Clostridium sp. ZS1]|uniref:SIR2 family NAD-dependent protein deacylase n=1 Tax=Clostridium sp. ZS1 TaxID=2949989 RepID=UPI001DD1A9C5|nr:SIR2 family protein [Clostridium sp. ZS1]MBN1067576.1 SIR2 family protein [Clostridium botulinum]
MIKKAFLSKLKKAYKENKLIPFIGTGLAIPFEIPNWGDLIIEIAENYVEENLIDAIKKYVERENYWKAINETKEFGDMSDRDVQEEIANIIKKHMNNEIETEKHNYIDLARGHFSNILTTNYDLLITKYINDPLVIPQVFYKVKFNSQVFFDCDDNKSKVWHLHGHIQDPDSIIISEEKYNELYENEQYKKLFEVFQSQGVLLFIGFSMNDKYIKDLLEKNKSYFNSQHYIMLDRPNENLKKTLKNDYSINVIEYDASKKGHAQAIREILDEIMENSTDNKGEENDIKEEEVKKKL